MAYIEKKPVLETIFDCLVAYLESYQTESPEKSSYIAGQICALLQVLNSADLSIGIMPTIIRLEHLAEKYRSKISAPMTQYFIDVIHNLEMDARGTRTNVRRIRKA